MPPQTCPLCSSSVINLFFEDRRRHFYRCERCNLIFVPIEDHIDPAAEKARYDLHQNSPEDKGYRSFLSRILPPLQPKINQGDRGLDYGSGPSPVLAAILRENGFQSVFYDPFYHNQPELLQEQYDFVTCTEVVEHFRHPLSDWKQLINLVKKGGWLAVMTQMTPETMAFDRWYYQRDETHVCFYTLESFKWIAAEFQLILEPAGQSIVLFQR